MSRRKHDEHSGQLASKRVRSSTPAFRIARTPAISRTSRVTTIRKNARGRRGHLTEDKVYSPKGPNPLIDERQPEADEIISDFSPYLEDPEEPLNTIPLQDLKAKRVQKNTTSAGSPSHEPEYMADKR
jgi:hypothetical protein